MDFSPKRAGKRQAAPFSKGAPTRKPKRPGRKKGKDYGTRGFRRRPRHVDEDHDFGGGQGGISCSARGATPNTCVAGALACVALLLATARRVRVGVVGVPAR